MAKVVITIEDAPGGRVKIVSDPNFETMLKMNISGEKLTAAHGYALFALNRIREESKRNEPTKLLIPKVKRT